jgi:hypothetical protein
MPSAGFEHMAPAIKQLQNYALDRTATGTSYSFAIRSHSNPECRGNKFLRNVGVDLQDYMVSKPHENSVAFVSC